MQNQKGISSSVGILIIIVIAIVAFGGVFAYQYFTPKTQSVVQTQQTQNTGNKSPIIEGISIEKPNLVVKGQNLSKVQIYLVPTGTGIDPETMSRIVDAVKQSENNGEQLWTYRYPSDLLITNIFAKGFDDKGNLVKEVDLPIVGATALADALYGNITDQTAGWKIYTNAEYGFELKYPQNFKVTADVSPARFLDVSLGYNNTPYLGNISFHVQKNYENETANQYFLRQKNNNLTGFASKCQTCANMDVVAEFYNCLLSKPGIIKIQGEDGFFCPNTYGQIFVFNNNFIYEFFAYDKSNSEYEIYKQVLSTFKFTN